MDLGGRLLSRSDTLRDNVADLATTWPLQALGILAEVERWQRPLIEQAVVAAREAGLSWAEIGSALGISRQSAHERFRNLAHATQPGDTSATIAGPSARTSDSRRALARLAGAGVFGHTCDHDNDAAAG